MKDTIAVDPFVVVTPDRLSILKVCVTPNVRCHPQTMIITDVFRHLKFLPLGQGSKVSALVFNTFFTWVYVIKFTSV